VIGPIQIPLAVTGFVLVFVGLAVTASGRFGRSPIPRREHLGMVIVMAGVTMMAACMFSMVGPGQRATVLAPLMVVSAVLGMSLERWRQAR
jgi:uncharacterized membrane protein